MRFGKKKSTSKSATKPTPQGAAKISFPRLPSGISGLDEILRGGFLQGGTYLILGAPGSGKTILANQLCFNQTKNDRRAIYVTLLAENHTRMFGHLDSLSFFDRAEVSSGVHYVSGYNVLEKDGLDGLMRLLSVLVQKHRSTVVCIDGVASLGDLSDTEVDFKKFVHNLNSVLGMSGCTTFLLSSVKGDVARPEYTMVDGIISLTTEMCGMHTARRIEVTKFRGSSHLHGTHYFEITDEGIGVYPRVECIFGHSNDQSANVTTRLKTGVPGLDAALAGGFSVGSTTSMLGPSGTGKTTMGIQFLVAGARQGDNGLLLSLYEHPNRLLPNMKLMNIDLAKYVKNGQIKIIRRLPTDLILDKLIVTVLDEARKTSAKRLLIDGVAGLKQAGILGSERLGDILKTLNAELKVLGTTTVFCEETDFDVVPHRAPLSYDSAITDDIVELHHVELEGRRTPVLNLVKTRSAELDPRYYELLLTDGGAKLGKPVHFEDAYLHVAEYVDR
jgi:circadian clock protein KaiC